ncbi:alpha/beta hydrolase [Pseudomonas typographi]|uniref:Phospholipase n=1 Tax=Pseudomonas typographi TaxID=2715964 RepID=A0ABR7Z8L5_9PSED|nr:dienelactone hydrolase family protein [Pseudomonas typographi]MBD1589701.1 phospholipase [Pseudomonas typographi]MBD1601732.1 phospholipase [Pseudomonas typographi]
MKPLITALLLLGCLYAQAQPVLQTDLALKYLVQTGPHPQGQPLVIFIHGYGANEEDLFSLKQRLPADYTYLSVRAPLEMSDGGYKWFTRLPGNGEYDGVPDELAASERWLTSFIQQAQHKYATDAAHTYLVGFSQGAILSYELALTNPRLVAGFAALSGKVLPQLREAAKPLPGVERLKVFIAHGTADSVLPYDSAPQANALLQRLGVTPQFHVYPGMDHTVNTQEVTDLATWLQGSTQ